MDADSLIQFNKFVDYMLTVPVAKRSIVLMTIVKCRSEKQAGAFLDHYYETIFGVTVVDNSDKSLCRFEAVVRFPTIQDDVRMRLTTALLDWNDFKRWDGVTPPSLIFGKSGKFDKIQFNGFELIGHVENSIDGGHVVFRNDDDCLNYRHQILRNMPLSDILDTLSANKLDFFIVKRLSPQNPIRYLSDILVVAPVPVRVAWLATAATPLKASLPKPQIAIDTDSDSDDDGNSGRRISCDSSDDDDDVKPKTIQRHETWAHGIRVSDGSALWNIFPWFGLKTATVFAIPMYPLLIKIQPTPQCEIQVGVSPFYF